MGNRKSSQFRFWCSVIINPDPVPSILWPLGKIQGRRGGRGLVCLLKWKGPGKEVGEKVATEPAVLRGGNTSRDGRRGVELPRCLGTWCRCSQGPILGLRQKSSALIFLLRLFTYLLGQAAEQVAEAGLQTGLNAANQPATHGKWRRRGGHQRTLWCTLVSLVCDIPTAARAGG